MTATVQDSALCGSVEGGGNSGRLPYIQIENGCGTDKWITVTAVRELTLPTTTHVEDSYDDRDSSDGQRTSVIGLNRGDLSLVLNFDRSNPAHNLLEDSCDERRIKSLRIVFPGAVTVARKFLARCKEFSPAAPTRGVQTANVAAYIYQNSWERQVLTS